MLLCKLLADKKGQVLLFPEEEQASGLSKADKAAKKKAFVQSLLSKPIIIIEGITPQIAYLELSAVRKERPELSWQESFRQTARNLKLSTAELNCLFTASRARRRQQAPR